MIEIKNLHAGYANMQILKGINLKVKPGSITAIVGPNGSGKSTSLKSIFKLCDIQSGSIVWNQKDITNLPTYQKISEGIAYVPQGRQVFQNLTVHENLKVATFALLKPQAAQSRLTQIYQQFPLLKSKMHQAAQLLSGGQQQMLALARALVQSPKLLLLDEPSLGLSPKAMQATFSMIQDINRQGVTIALVEQNTKAALAIADQTLVLEGGKIVLRAGQ